MSSADAAPLHRNDKLKYFENVYQCFEQITYSRLKEFNELVDENMWLQSQWTLPRILEETVVNENVIQVVQRLFKIFKEDVEKLHALFVKEHN